jgi:hypothetical protein
VSYGKVKVATNMPRQGTSLMHSEVLRADQS